MNTCYKLLKKKYKIMGGYSWKNSDNKVYDKCKDINIKCYTNWNLLIILTTYVWK